MLLDSLGNGRVVRLVEDQIRSGNAFGATSGKLTLAGAGNVGVALWNPAGSGKYVYLYGLQALSDMAVAFGTMSHLTSAPAWTAGPVLNKHRTSATMPVALFLTTTTAGAQPAAVVTTDTLYIPAGTMFNPVYELELTWLPSGTGIELWLPLTGAGNVAVNVDWLETSIGG